MKTKAFFGLVLGVALAVPVFALAQAQTVNYPSLFVSIQTAGGSSIPPSQGIVTVNAQGASLSGAPSGNSSLAYTTSFNNDVRTVTLLPSSYSVTLSPVTNYTYSYSSGCSGSLTYGDNATCTVTASQYGAANGTGALVCTPAYQTAALGPTVVLTAIGGNGTYTWTAPGQSYPNPNSGNAVNVIFSAPGPQTVTVVSGGQTAACTVDVVGNGYWNGYSYPSLPNTGFAPVSVWQYGLAAVLLFAFGYLAYPYARNALTYIRR